MKATCTALQSFTSLVLVLVYVHVVIVAVIAAVIVAIIVVVAVVVAVAMMNPKSSLLSSVKRPHSNKRRKK